MYWEIDMFDYSDTTFTVNEDIIENLSHLIGQQENIIAGDVIRILQQMVEQVQEGVWRGEGAQTFVAELENNLIPLFSQLANFLIDMEQGTRRLLDIVEDAEFQVTKAVDSQIQLRKII